jgi:hypothetical protein
MMGSEPARGRWLVYGWAVAPREGLATLSTFGWALAKGM